MQQEFQMLDHSLHHPFKKKYDDFKATLVQHKISFGNYFLFFFSQVFGMTKNGVKQFTLQSF